MPIRATSPQRMAFMPLTPSARLASLDVLLIDQTTKTFSGGG
jgi:hypothetical protein